MSLSSDTDAKLQAARSQARTRLEHFPIDSIFTSQEQMQRFELLRLAFFVLKLRKLNEQIALADEEGISESEKSQMSFRRNLLHHIIFQQILTLTRLDAREQAMQIISACHTKK
ncbi:MAG TPA: hypothetical protein VKV19_11465 [Ktedonobacteraceae bacterium]|nr:hypothetical protein [Ktedonobacteraceae bacterium]